MGSALIRITVRAVAQRRASKVLSVWHRLARQGGSALVTAGAVYVLVGVVASATVPTGTPVRSSGPLLEVVKEAGGVPLKLFSAVALVAVAVANGALLTGIMSTPLAYGMARDGLLPRSLGHVLPGYRTPWASIAATTRLSFLLAPA